MRFPAPVSLLPRHFLGLVLALSCLTGLRADPGVIVITDVTKAGRAWTLPSPQQPAYYQAVYTGFESFGRAIAGDREPPDDKMLQVVLRALKQQGYLPSSEAHPPTLVFGISWGTILGNAAGALQFLGGEKLDLMWEERRVSNMLDPRVLTRGMRSPLQVQVMEMSGSGIYVVRVKAYDRAAVLEGEMRELWETRIATEMRGRWAENALPLLVKIGAPHFGRETTLPTWVPPHELHNADVQIGELETLGTFDLKDLPLISTKELNEEE